MQGPKVIKLNFWIFIATNIVFDFIYLSFVEM